MGPVYVKVWTWCWVAVAGIGLACALVSVSRGSAAADFCFGATLGFIVAWLRHQPAGPVVELGGMPGDWLRSSVYGGTLLIAGHGVGRELPLLVFLLVVVAIASSPLVVARVLGRVPGVVVPAAPEPVAPTANGAVVPVVDADVSPLADLDDRALCAAWRESYWLLRDARSPLERLTVVVCRSAYLEELERRDSGAVDAWMSAGGKASSSPDRFMRTDRTRE